MIAACIAYIISLAGVYLCSMVSHAVAEPKLKLAWERWDQAMIYLLIAGAYTPYAAAYLRTGFLADAHLGDVDSGDDRIPDEDPLLPPDAESDHLDVRGARLAADDFRCPVMLPQMTTDCIVWTFAGGACFMMGTLFFDLRPSRAVSSCAVGHLAVLAGTGFHSQRFMCLWSKRP